MARILIVEDDIDLVETYTDLLELNHHRVTSVTRANEAFGALTRFRPDIVLLDLNLSGYSGTVIVSIIRKAELFKNTRIIVVTGHVEMLTQSSAWKQVDLVLNKPVSNEQLLLTVSQFVDAS